MSCCNSSWVSSCMSCYCCSCMNSCCKSLDCKSCCNSSCMSCYCKSYLSYCCSNCVLIGTNVFVVVAVIVANCPIARGNRSVGCSRRIIVEVIHRCVVRIFPSIIAIRVVTSLITDILVGIARSSRIRCHVSIVGNLLDITR